MTLLGQHGQRQDYARGVHLVRLAAQSADENAPQGAYVGRTWFSMSTRANQFYLGLRYAFGKRTSWYYCPRGLPAPGYQTRSGDD